MTRRSTSSSFVMLGGHMLAASATTQNVVATSSGEAEFHALTMSASRALRAVAMAADMTKMVTPRVRVDATAPKAVASRRGVVRVRHLHTQVLWVQEAVARRELTAGSRKSRRHGNETLGSEGKARTLEESRMPYHRRTVEDGVQGCTGGLESAALRLRKRQVENIDWD